MNIHWCVFGVLLLYTFGVSGHINKECQKYSKWIAKTESKERKNNIYSWKVKKLKSTEFPNVVQLGYLQEENQNQKDIKWRCGGTLLNERFILTAAHCLLPPEGVKIWVKVGLGNPKGGKIYKVFRKFEYPTFNSSLFYNDIGIIELDERLVFDDFIRPACLQTSNKMDADYGVAVSWRQKDTMLKVKFPIIDQGTCSKAYAYMSMVLLRGIDFETMLCAKDSLDSGDVCAFSLSAGDPLQTVLKSAKCRYSVVGITSFGSPCGRTPEIFTRVSGFIEWIDSIICPELYDY